MLKATIDSNQDTVSIEMGGSLLEVLNDLCNLIGGIHSCLHSDGPEFAAVFRENLARAVCDPASDLWAVANYRAGQKNRNDLH